MPPPLILASTSPYRQALLARLGLAFTVLAPGVAETHREGEPPRDRARRLAAEKARAVARAHPGAAVIGSDQVCALDTRVLDKPGSPERARAQLRAASGRQVDFFTAVALAAGDPARCTVRVDHTRVRFRPLDEARIAAYVARENPLDCAGSFRCEGLGIVLFEHVTTDDPTALVGLPLIALTGLLEEAGIAPLAA